MVTLTSNASAITGIANTDTLPYTKSVGFKQSFLSMINSITVDLNGQPMVQQNQLIDMYNHFRLLTSESWNTQNRWSSIGFYPDVAESLDLALLTVSMLLRDNLRITILLM